MTTAHSGGDRCDSLGARFDLVAVLPVVLGKPIEQDFALGQLIDDLRSQAGLSQRVLAERMGTTQPVISRLEEGGGAKNRLDTLARVATALDRHLAMPSSFDAGTMR